MQPEDNPAFRKHPKEAKKTIRRIASYGHFSVLEHATFTYSVEGVSRAFSHQLVRHRIASYTQQSQRYVPYKTIDQYIIPRKILEDENAKKIYDSTLEKIMDAYQQLLDQGVPEEDARYVLPNAAKTNIVVSMNARELRHFFNLRCCERAQWEIREVAMEMLKQAKKVAPMLFENAGPSCVEFGYCPEKELKPSTCKIDKLKQKFMAL